MEEEPRGSVGKQVAKGVKKFERTVAGQLDNARITSAVKAALLTSLPFTGLDVNVDTDCGVVFLRGQVKTERQKQEAERIAWKACPKGMTGLVNELEVNPKLIPPFPI